MKVVPGLQGCVMGSLGPTSDRGSQLCHCSTGAMCTKGTAISVGALTPSQAMFMLHLKADHAQGQGSSLQQNSIRKSFEFSINRDEAVDQKSL